MIEFDHHADEILRNPAWEHAYNSLESSLTERWKNTTPDQWRNRERLYDQMQSLKDVRQQLETLIATGQFARKP